MHEGRCRKLIIVLIAAFFLAYVLLGFKVNLPGRLEVAHAQWDAQHIENYRYRVQFGSFSWIGGVFITVLNDQVTKIEKDNTNPLDYPRPNPPNVTSIPANPDWYKTNFSRFFPTDLSKYSVDDLFDFAENHPQPLLTICGDIGHYELSYDSLRGYVDDVRFTQCVNWDFGLGLLCGVISDCSSGFRVIDFEVLPT